MYDEYSDRACDPSETVLRMRPHFAALGITRLARQTGLDRLGIPCFAAIRPNSRTLSTNQGKGLDDDAASASAIMEAAEYAIAEEFARIDRTSSIESLREGQSLIRLPHSRLPLGEDWDKAKEMAWLEGVDYLTGQAAMVPAAIVGLGGDNGDYPHASRSTNGLASGNNAAESSLHAICELIERDAMTLWSLRSDSRTRSASIDIEAYDDRIVRDLAATICAADLRLTLFDLTSDIGVPVILALIAEPGPLLHFDLASGVGCHPVATRATIKAITEAAQTRITNISGARDDFDPREYGRGLAPDLARLAKIEVGRARPSGVPVGASIERLHDALSLGLRGAHIDDVSIVHLGGDDLGISVVQAFSPRLEDMPVNRHWRPGIRAIREMTRLM